MLRRDGFSSQSNPAEPIGSGEAAGKPDCPTSGVILTRGKGFSHNAAAVECETAYHCFTTQLDSMVSGISQQILSIQKDRFDTQLQREVKSEEEKELKVSRVEFVQKIEDLCRERSRSCVVYSSFQWEVID